MITSVPKTWREWLAAKVTKFALCIRYVVSFHGTESAQYSQRVSWKAGHRWGDWCWLVTLYCRRIHRVHRGRHRGLLCSISLRNSATNGHRHGRWSWTSNSRSSWRESNLTLLARSCLHSWPSSCCCSCACCLLCGKGTGSSWWWWCRQLFKLNKRKIFATTKKFAKPF